MPTAEITKAGREYVFSVTFWMAVYVALVSLAIWAKHAGGYPAPLSYLIAASPALPIGGIILALLRFIERSDEYVRALTIRRYILATGLTLFACSAWGFSESFAGAAHLPLWIVFPAFWCLYGVVVAAVRNPA